MSKHLFTACLGTETHTWAPLPTDIPAFEATYLVRDGKHPEAVNMFGVPLQIWKRRAEAKGAASSKETRERGPYVQKSLDSRTKPRAVVVYFSSFKNTWTSSLNRVPRGQMILQS